MKQRFVTVSFNLVSFQNSPCCNLPKVVHALLVCFGKPGLRHISRFFSTYFIHAGGVRPQPVVKGKVLFLQQIRDHAAVGIAFSSCQYRKGRSNLQRRTELILWHPRGIDAVSVKNTGDG